MRIVPLRQWKKEVLVESVEQRFLRVVTEQMFLPGKRFYLPDGQIADQNTILSVRWADIADSMDMVDILMAAEEEFGVEFDEDELGGIETVGDAVAYISGRIATGG